MSAWLAIGVVGVVVAGAACGGNVLLGSPEDGGTDGGGCKASCPGGETDAGSTLGSDDAGLGIGDAISVGEPEPAEDAAGEHDATLGPDAAVRHDAAVGDDAVSEAGATPLGFDAAILDGALPDASGSPVETFEFIVGGVAREPLTCPSARWEYKDDFGQANHSVYLRNTGAVPLAYLASALWDVGGMYSPGVATGATQQLAGVLAPGAVVNITSAYDGGFVAIVGSSKPFSPLDAGYVYADEGTIMWPLGVSGSEGATVMYVAQIVVGSSCQQVQPLW